MADSLDLEHRLRAEIMKIVAVDVHSHVPAAEPFALTLRDLLGYHYYTELAHSAGLDKAAVDADQPDDVMIPRLVEALARVDNTVQYSWLMELARELFGFDEPRITPSNWERLAEAVVQAAREPDRAREVMEQSRIDRVFLTNNFDEDLSEIDTSLFVPSLRADSLVMQFASADVQQGLEAVTGIAARDAASAREALGRLVERFRRHGAGSAAISLPPGFAVGPVSDSDFSAALGTGLDGDTPATASEFVTQSWVLFRLAELCGEHGMPFQIMFGVVRDAFPDGVHQGRDLPQAGGTLGGLLPLINALPQVTFCLSALSEGHLQELNSYGWLVPNVVLSGHWWYLNVPEYIAADLGARLQSVPKTKLIGYYSDAYKLEFALAKFNMYRGVLAHVLAGHFVRPGYGTEEDAVALARLLLRDNAVRIFGLEA